MRWTQILGAIVLIPLLFFCQEKQLKEAAEGNSSLSISQHEATTSAECTRQHGSGTDGQCTPQGSSMNSTSTRPSLPARNLAGYASADIEVPLTDHAGRSSDRAPIPSVLLLLPFKTRSTRWSERPPSRAAPGRRSRGRRFHAGRGRRRMRRRRKCAGSLSTGRLQ